MVTAAVVVMVMFMLMVMMMADSVCGFQFSLQVLLHRGAGIALDAHHDLNLALLEQRYGVSPHTACNHDLHSHITQEVGQEAGLMFGVGYQLLTGDLAVLRRIDAKMLTMTKMTSYLCSHAGNCNFHALMLPFLAYAIYLMLSYTRFRHMSIF